MPPANDAIRNYLERMVEIRSAGGATGETSYYSALENLLNAFGKLLNPNVICNGQLRNQGAGHPDFGLYSKKQLSKGTPKGGLGDIPERGVIEVKSLSDNTWQTAKGKQATKYFDRYRLVLITNYREFRLIGEDENGKPVEREYFKLADSEPDFWAVAAHPSKTATTNGVHLGEFLQRVLMNAAPLSRPEDVAWFLASYAREGLAELEAKDGSALAPLREALETALGIKFDGERGEHFFRSTLVQTLFYGAFSAWVIKAKDGGSAKFDWRHAGYILTVPMIRSLFEEVAKPSRLAPLGLMSILDRTSDALNRVDRTAFFKSFDTDEAVQHFYEPFLEAFDPELRKQMGVWYTPPEIVRYMVARVDAVLRTELGIADGLADKNVYVLDPCCGTGAYVVEVLRKIEETLRAKGDDPLIGQDVKQAARERVFGFEIMSAPFVIAHWRVGDLLTRLGAPIDASTAERPSIFLTNALTGWRPPAGPKANLPLFPDLAEERDHAEHVKRDVPILVVLGNPPYNAFAGTSPEEEDGLVEPYKEGLIDIWGIKKFNLDELYVRFLRIAERRIAATKRGLVCYISNYSYLSDPSFVVARQKLLAEFDDIWIDCLNGDSRETGKRTPTGESDPSIFSTPFNKAGIRVGTSIGLFLRRHDHAAGADVRFRDFWGASKRSDLIASLSVQPFDNQYAAADPQKWNRLSFRPNDVGKNYLSWPTLVELAAVPPVNGLMEKRGGALIDIDRSALATRMKVYFDPKIEWTSYKSMGSRLSRDAARFDAENARKSALTMTAYTDSQLVRYIVRPFDIRYAYFTEVRPIWNEPRPKLWAQFRCGTKFLMSRPGGVANPEGPPILFTQCLGDNDAQRGHAYYFPIKIHETGIGLLAGKQTANLSAKARNYLGSLQITKIDSNEAVTAAIWHHALSIGFSPRYLADNADGLAIDWPRIPLPTDRTLFEVSTTLGARVAELLDTEIGVKGVTLGAITEPYKSIAGITSTDLRITAGWGNADKKGSVYPGRGKTVVRDWSSVEKSQLESGFTLIGLETERGYALLVERSMFTSMTRHVGAVCRRPHGSYTSAAIRS